MQVRHGFLALALAACQPFELHDFPPVCDPAVETCPPDAGSTAATTTIGDDIPDGVQTVTTATTTSAGATTSDPDPGGDTEIEPPEPAIESVSLQPDPLKFAGSIDVDVVATDAEGVRLQYPGAEVELEKGPNGHFRGRISASTGLTNGTYQAILAPWRGETAGEPESRFYTFDLPPAGEVFLWDTMPDHGSGQVEALRVAASGHVIALMTIYQNGVPRCALHRRDLEGKYTEADDIRVIFPDKECQAIDLEVDGEILYLLISMKGGDSWFWRVGSAVWGQDPTILRTGAKDEKAHALARSPAGKTAICGTAPSPILNQDKLDGRVWPLVGAPVGLDYVAPDDPQQKEHLFDETLWDCEFGADERLVAVGDVFGWHEGDLLQPKRMRPLIVEMDGQNEPVWHVDGLGPGNTTQGSISALAIDGEGRYVTGLYTCGDTCDQQGEIRVYEPGGKLSWPLTLGANILPPQDVAWSPAGYIVFASAEATGQWSSKFVVQAYIPGQYEPAWTFAKAEMPNLHLGRALTVGLGAVVGGGVGGTGFPALAFLRP